MAPGHRRRVMKKVFENGVDSLFEHEFLELCLFSVYKRCDTNKLAHDLLEKFGNLDAVCNASVEELMTVNGIGPSAAEYIRLIPYISKGYSMHTSVRKRKIFNTRESICERCVALLKGFKAEAVYVLCFDNKYHLLKEVKIAEGSPGSVTIEPRSIMNAVANTSTTSVALCHNHPSGIRTPSNQDYATTASVRGLLKQIGIKLIDHVVVTDDTYVSCVAMEKGNEIYE